MMFQFTPPFRLSDGDNHRRIPVVARILAVKIWRKMPIYLLYIMPVKDISYGRTIPAYQRLKMAAPTNLTEPARAHCAAADTAWIGRLGHITASRLFSSMWVFERI
jgi:hypothetical protein